MFRLSTSPTRLDFPDASVLTLIGAHFLSGSLVVRRRRRGGLVAAPRGAAAVREQRAQGAVAAARQTNKITIYNDRIKVVRQPTELEVPDTVTTKNTKCSRVLDV